MGQTLSEPVIDKHTASGEDDRLAWGVSEMQGWRLTMEDAHAHELSLGPENNGKKTSFFAVYDGHGGSTVARFAGDTVHSRLAANEAFKKRDFEAALKRAFLETDEDLRANPDFRGDPSGCTAVSMIVTEDLKLICANAGDSRAVMSVKGEAVALSEDHKPTNAGESARIVAAGGFVEFGRVNGNLALSRALGDFEFKQSDTLSPETQIVTADPEITVHEHTDEDEFVVIACDGIWDVFSSQQVIDFVRRGISEHKELATISEELMDRCLAPDSDWGGVGCDNMTAMVIAIKADRTKEEWYNWITEKVKSEPPTAVFDPFAQGPRGGAPGGGRAVPGSLSQALSRQPGGGNDEGDDDDEENAISLPMLQAALRAQGLQIRVAGQGEEGDEEEGSEDETMEGEAKVEEIEEVDVRDEAKA